MQIDYEHLENQVTKAELEKFRALKRVKVVIDIGAKNNIEMIQLKPKAIFHLFEPKKKTFEELQVKVGSYPNVYLNNFGIADRETELSYDEGSEMFEESEANPAKNGHLYPVKTLDSYLEKNNIARIDFLKIDAEAWDYKILKGNPKAVSMARYIQYEYWNDPKEFEELLGKDFILEEIGGRNVFCTRK